MLRVQALRPLLVVCGVLLGACQCAAPSQLEPEPLMPADGGPTLTPDAAVVGCRANEECPPGFDCLLSEERCIPSGMPDAGEPPPDAGVEDGGLPPACDDGEERSCGTSKLGECRLGVQQCAGGAWGQCAGAIEPLPESCDDRDNDCDGRTDEDFDKQASLLHCGACNNACAFPGATAACVAGACQLAMCLPNFRDLNQLPADGCECGLTNGGVETCDGLDNDCDGQVDEGLGTTSCGVGQCRATPAACVNGQPQACTPNAPSPEVCDGQDNDCDGMVDEGLADLTCGQGSCFRRVAACVSGAPQSCTPGAPSAEVCDGVDNNCDGRVDEGCLCVDGTTQSCYSGTPGTAGVGVCRTGLQTCASGAWGACSGQVVDSAETCDGLDNNCNGATDEALGSTTCGTGACQRTQQNCVGGTPRTCTAGTPTPEVCDGVDNNCNGSIDEGLGTTTCGTGACRVTVTACVGGATQLCTPGTPSAEVCDGVDNNCNGTTDEGLGSTTCGTGACQVTQQNCVAGSPRTCSPGTPTAEVCDGVDNNCNGSTDEGLGNLSCGQGDCQVTVAACVGGSAQTCTPGTPTAEVCDGRDNNCNGAVDETFPQQMMSCSTGLQGPCAAGSYQCLSGAVSCRQTVMAVTEVCGNGIDDDCNGVIDNPGTCGCNSTIDLDTDGANQCLDCNDNDGSIFPGAVERCNGKDDNCNGGIDEGFDVDMDGFTTCGTVPGGGLSPARVDCNDNNAFVFPGKVTDCGNASTPTVANGVDDNCNGYTDETCGSCTDKDRDNWTTCQGDCNDNDASVYPGAPEICDGKDNDCNRLTLDNCGVSDPCGSKQGPSWVQWPAGTDRCQPDLVCVSDLSTGALTCGSFCNQTLGSGLNDSCASGEGCNQTLLRSDNQHLCSKTAVGTLAIGAACTADSQCRSGTCRTDGTSRYCTDSCANPASCGAAATCVMNKSSFFQMGTTYQWFNGSCRLNTLLTGTLNLGQSCTGTQCKAGTEACFNGTCTIPCCKHADCGAGYVCSALGPRQSIVGGTQVSVFPACLASSATKIAGQACTGNPECKSGICDKNLNICIDLCCNDASCANGTTCEPVDLKFATGQTTLVRACVFSPVPAQLEQK